jgi:NAD(P)-dependent dehydrogenase (short-subunit alcohol dehydrogenase family)
MQKDKYVLITGASSGIGLDACSYLIQKGFKVIGTVRKENDRERLQHLFPVDFECLIMDVTKTDDIEAVSSYLNKKLKDIGLFGLVNNAGIAKGGPLMHVSNEDFELQLNTNFSSIFRITNSLLSLLGAEKNSKYSAGRIVNISSVSGLINIPMLGPYCISKHALESMSDIYRRELAYYGIKLVLIEPGPIQTPIWQKSVPEKNPIEHTDFKGAYDGFKKSIQHSEKNALPVEYVSKTIYKALTKKKPSNRYIISRTKFLTKFLSVFVPSAWLDAILIKQLKEQMSRDGKTIKK